MLCTHCQHLNPPGAKFCNACGAKLEVVCAACQHLNPPESRFCNECGAALSSQPKPPVPSSKPVLSLVEGFQVPSQDSEPRTPNPELSPISYTPSRLAEWIRAEQIALEARGSADGERKTITALFADLKGSTALIEGLDPEEARAIIDPALQLMMDAVHHYEGYVAQALGDGIFALFGAPIAHEDHPQRALYAALRMQEEMQRYGDQIRLKHGVPLTMRVGVNTGEVVLRSIRKDDLHADYVPVGHSTNLAARMEQMATPGSILITEDTKRLVEGYFALKALGAAEIKGRAEPLHVYEVLGAGPLRTRMQVAATRRGLTRFVGRQREMEQLQTALTQAKAGHGQIVGVMGEPGLGKSRLFYEFKLLSQVGGLILEAYSASYGKASPYLPLIELLKSYFQLQPQDDERQRKEKIAGKVLILDRNLDDTLPYLFLLLGIDEPTSSLQQMDPQIRRRRTFDALKKLFLRESLNQPLILVFEDLHWIDSETQGFLDVLSESVAGAHILLLINYRPEYRSEWGQKTYYTQLRLAPFGKEEAEEFLTILLGEHRSPLPARLVLSPVEGERDRVRGMEEDLHALKQLILDKTGGTPFFMEEVVQELIEQGLLVRDAVGTRHAVPFPQDLHIPTTVQGVLTARIDRLAPDEKALLQQLAVIGREFPLSLVRRVVSQSEEELYRLLSSLQRKEFLYEQPAFPEVEYIFKHALTQEVSYNSVLQERRKAWHEQTAQALESLYPNQLDEHYSELAHHYSRSGNTQKAIEYLQLAGRQAEQRSANTEAVNHLTTALTLLKTLPDTRERTQRELVLQIALGAPLLATQGLASVQAERTYVRAQELCRQLGETQQLFPVLSGLGTCYQQQGKIQAAHELGEQSLSLAQSLQDPVLITLSEANLGMTSFFLGELTQAREHLEHGITLYHPHLHDVSIFHYWCDPGVLCRGFAAKTLRLLGYPDQALQRSREALDLAHELSHPQSMAFALYVSGVLHHFRREGQETQERAEAEISLTDEQGFPLWFAWGVMLRGCALAEQGQAEESIAQLRNGLAAFRALGSGLLIPYCLSLLAEAYGKMGQAAKGLNVLEEALDVMGKTGERWYEAELYRLRGELTLAQSRVQSLGSSVQTRQKAKGKRQKSTGETNPQPLAPNPQGEVEREAEGCFQRAIAIAQRQQAKSLELRAVMSLVRLRQHQAQDHAPRATQHDSRTQLDEVHQMLSEVYNWFTEGFDTKDLHEAKTLVEELHS
jgi:class 3 adenylate cyclase/predicted ATPase